MQEALTKTQQRGELLFREPDIETIETGIVRIDPNMPMERAEALWQKFTSVQGFLETSSRSVQFVLGDFMVFCEQAFGEEAYQIFDEADWRRLRNWRWVCSNMPPEMRVLNDAVSYAHYREIITTPREEWPVWMQRCAAERQSVRALATDIRKQNIKRRIVGRSESEKNLVWAYAKAVDYKMLPIDAALERGLGWIEEELSRIESFRSFDSWWLVNAERLGSLSPREIAAAVWEAKKR